MTFPAGDGGLQRWAPQPQHSQRDKENEAAAAQLLLYTTVTSIKI